ncbi:MAG: OmpA family protein [Bacteroidales bacterium]|nr:OmpA family protein [Bacteroidales bacterium]
MYKLPNLKIKVVSAILFFTYSAVFAQTEKIATMKNWELIGYGKDAERVNDVYSAIDFYAEYIKRKPKKQKISFKLAKMYFDVNDFAKAKGLFEKLAENSIKKYPNSRYYFAEILRIESKYDSAITEFTKFQELFNKNKRKNLLYYISDVKIESCIYAANNLQLKKNFEVNHLNTSINKAHMESAPVIINNSVFVYSSLVADSVPLIGSGSKSPAPFHQFYKARLMNNKWQGGLTVDPPFYNSDSLFTSNGAFSEDRSRFYFTISIKNKYNKLISSIYVSQLKNNTWSKPEMLDENINMPGYNVTQPGSCDYLKDYEVLYFVSDRPGGWGNYDIWYTIFNKNTKTYNKPVNAGGYLNSAGADITPNYDSETNTMYFSSDGQVGYGGFDVYRSNGALVEWLPPENLGLPINSNYNDIYYRKQTDKESGFIVSNRDESVDLKNPNCCYDIFEYSQPEKFIIRVHGTVAKKTVNAIEDIYNQMANDTVSKTVITKKMANEKIQLWMMSKVSGISVLIESALSDEDGGFDFKKIEKDRNYIIRVDDKTLLKKELHFKTDNILSDTLIVLDTTFVELIPQKPIVFEKIYFEFNKTELTNESKKIIDATILKIMEKHPDIVVEIGAHTDYFGKNNYNLKLSQERAESVVNYLISKGVSKARLIPVGYGEEEPLLVAQTAEGDDIPEAREKNRRIEFKIIGTLGDK